MAEPAFSNKTQELCLRESARVADGTNAAAKLDWSAKEIMSMEAACKSRPRGLEPRFASLRIVQAAFAVRGKNMN